MAIKDLAFDPVTGFLSVSGGLSIASGAQVIANHVNHGLQTRLGELPYNTRRGIDWFNVVLVKNPDPALVQAEFLRFLRNTRGVLAVENYQQNINASSRLLTVTFRLITTEGALNAEAIADPARAAEAARLGGVNGLARDLEEQGAFALAQLIRERGISAIAPTLAQHPQWSDLQYERDTEEWLPFMILLYPPRG